MQKPYEELTKEEKGTLVLSSDVFVFPHNDPEVAVDYAGISGTLSMTQFLDVVNNSTLDLYFKIEATVLSGDSSKWSNLSSTFPVVNSNSKEKLEWELAREVPGGKTTEILRVNVKAYKDSGYTDLFGEDFTDFTYHFFNHSQGTIVDFSDFENSFDGWTRTKYGDYYFGNLATFAAYTGAYSIKLNNSATENKTTDSSGQVIPTKDQFLSKTFDLSSYSSAYFVLHYTYRKLQSGTESYPVVRIWTDSGLDYIIRVPIEKNKYEPYRIAVPLNTIANETVHVTAVFGGNSHYSFADTFIVVGFS